MARAVGILEVYGLTTAFVAADAACKAADVVLENFDKNKPANAESLLVHQRLRPTRLNDVLALRDHYVQ